MTPDLEREVKQDRETLLNAAALACAQELVTDLLLPVLAELAELSGLVPTELICGIRKGQTDLKPFKAAVAETIRKHMETL